MVKYSYGIPCTRCVCPLEREVMPMIYFTFQDLIGFGGLIIGLITLIILIINIKNK